MPSYQEPAFAGRTRHHRHLCNPRHPCSFYCSDARRSSRCLYDTKGWLLGDATASQRGAYLWRHPKAVRYLLRVFWGTHSAFRVAVVLIAMAVLIDIALSSLAGYFGELLDEVIMRITDIFLALPELIVAMAIVTAIGHSLKRVTIALTVVSWPSYARLIPGDILQAREEGYIEASRGLGASSGGLCMTQGILLGIRSCIALRLHNIVLLQCSSVSKTTITLSDSPCASDGIMSWRKLHSRHASRPKGPAPCQRSVYNGRLLSYNRGYAIGCYGVIGRNLTGR